jgi:hypothetical protein
MKHATRTISLRGVIRDGDFHFFHQRQAGRAAHRQGAAMSKSVTQPNTQSVDALYQGIKQLVDGARSQVLIQVNQALVLTYWHIGKTIKTQVLQSERATYGAGVLKQLALRLTQDYGSGFSHSGLTRMAKFFEALPDEAIVATLSQQLSWSHFVNLLTLKRLDKHERQAGEEAPIGLILRARTLAQRKLPLENRISPGHFDSISNKIKLTTMNVDKGLVFPVVALPGVGHMPAAGEDEKEAARVFYVAATRATQRLVIGANASGEFGRRLG